MPKVVETPSGLKPFTFHGVEFGPVEGSNAAADCPLCGRERKFFVHVETGLWDCKKCGESGNPTTFLRKKYEGLNSNTQHIEKLARDRKFLTSSVLNEWGVRFNDTEPIVPGYGPDGQLNQLYRYVKDHKTKKSILLATPTLHHQVHGVNLYDPAKGTVYVTEGPWDAIALWEVLRSTKVTETGYAVTSNPEASLAADANVLALPGCNVFHDSWASLFAGKRVVICFDSDHPRENNGQVVPPAGWTGAKRLAGKLAGATEPPESIHVLTWGPDGYDPNLKSGYDVRDYLMQESGTKTISLRFPYLKTLLEKIAPIPEDWVLGRSSGTAAKGGVRIEMVDCKSWKDLVNQWRKAMNWSEGLDRALSVILSSAMSTQMVGDQLWVKVISPPSTGKTQLCDGLGVNFKQVRSVGNFTGLHSGFQTDRDGEEDHSLLSAIKGMTLVVKDADTILKNPNREKILGQLRDAYDMNCAVAYANKVKREYTNHRFTVIMAGTEALMEMDSADLGARFLDCVIMNAIDPDVEADVNRRGFYRIANNRGVSANGDANTQDDAAMTRAKAMTGGYLHHLRTNAEGILAGVGVGDDGDAVQERISHLAQFVAFARARPSKTQEEAVTREMSARVNSQLSKLAFCLAAVMNRKTLDDEVMRRVSQVAKDTARGKVLDIITLLGRHGQDGVESQTVSGLVHHGIQKTQALLRFLRSIGAVEWFHPKTTKGVRSSAVRWRLTPQLRTIYEKVEGEKI